MQCPKCNFENPAEAKFCGRCGEAIKQPAPPPLTDNGVSPELKIGIAIGSFFFFPLGIIMGAIYLNDPNPKKKEAGKLWLFIGLGAMALICACGALSALFGNNNNYRYNY